MSTIANFSELEFTADQEKAAILLEDFFKSNNDIFLLKGYAGSGKTSLIKALAGHIDRSLCLIPLTYTENMSKALQKIPGESIAVIEDIDTCGEIHKRKKENKDVSKEGLIEPTIKPVTETNMESMMSRFSNLGMSSLLNAIDGAITIHGRILIMTTNHKEKIDEALLRPGRVDLQMEIGYFTMELFKQFILSFFPNTNEDIFNNRELIDSKLTGAELQGDILFNLDAKQIINKRTKESLKR